MTKRPDSDGVRTEPVLACAECDLLHADVSLPEGTSARCRRCGATLACNAGGRLERPLALAAAALVLFVVANSNAILELDFNGQTSSATLMGAVARLIGQDMWAVALLVLMTTFVCPVLQLGAMCYLLLPLYLDAVPPGFATMLRLIQLVQPWGMLEVFVLGALVSLAKLTSIAAVIPGLGLYSLGVLILLTAGAAMTFDSDDLWRRADALARQRRPAAVGG